MEPSTVVVFRRWRRGPYRDVLALFPALDEGSGHCASYAHVGQHGAADYALCVSATIPADVAEPDVAALKRELESLGYRLEVRARRPRR